MDYLKIPVICVEAVLALTVPERGRLLGSLLRYLQGSEEGAEEPRGNEYSLYLVLRAQMDQDRRERERAAERKRNSRAGQSVTTCDRVGQPVTSCDTAGHPVTRRDPSSPLSPSPSSPPIPPLSPLSPISPSPKEKPPYGGKKKGPFVPPTEAEVAAYCRARGNDVDPAAFVAHYQANGWVQGRGKPIVDWQAAVRTWERSRRPSQTAPREVSHRIEGLEY